MKKEFVPYYLAVQLKDLGFDEECLGSFTIEDNSLQIVDMYNLPSVVKAPLWQQAFDWFRFEHGHYCNIVPNPTSYIKHKNKEWLFGYNIINGVNPMFDLRYKTYEEARLKCLEKLIELCEKEIK